MPDSVRDYLHASCIVLGIIALLVAGGLFWAAMTLSYYIAAIVVGIIGGAFLFVAHCLNPEQTKSDLDGFVKHYGASSSREGGKGGT